MNLNRVLVGGHLTRDPELRYTPKGTAVVNFGVAVNRKWKSDGEDKEEVAFIDLAAFGKTAEMIGSHFKKGNPILVEGRLKTESWEDRQTKQKRSKLVVNVDNFHFVGGGERREPAPEKAAKPTGEAPPLDDDVPF